MLIFRALLVMVMVMAWGLAWSAEGDAGVPLKPEAVPAATVSTVPPEEKWIFEPNSGRIDAFWDVEVRTRIELSPTSTPGGTLEVVPGDDRNKIDTMIEWGAKEADRVEGLILARRWDETIQACDSAVKSLEKYQSNGPVADLIERFKRYRTQAEEAKIYEEAQAKFDALGLKIEGILWSPEGSLAVVGGEPRALKINDRAKDCVIINIDTN